MQKQVFYETKEKSGTNINQSISGDKKSLWSFFSPGTNIPKLTDVTPESSPSDKISSSKHRQTIYINIQYNRDVIKNGVHFFIRFHIDFLFLFLT